MCATPGESKEPDLCFFLVNPRILLATITSAFREPLFTAK
jgi:hypothetical protein